MPQHRLQELPQPLSLETRVDLLEKTVRQLNAELSEILVSVHDMQKCLTEWAGRAETIEKELRVNNVTTTEIKELLTTAKAGVKLFSSFGALIKWMSAVAVAGYALWYMATHGGKPPGG